MPTPNFNFPTINQSDTANVPRDHNALATAIDTAFQQTEYQTASVVGAQIRVTKPSASNRIFFRLMSTINAGTPITISTDGGSTSVNLTDNDGANVTVLEKGFTEIVKVGNFFILRSKGISPAQLSSLAGIIGAPAVATDSFDAQLTKLQDSKDILATKLGMSSTSPIREMVDDVQIGKKSASGTITSSSTTTAFQYYATTSNQSLADVTISTLDFRPSRITIAPVTGTSSARVTEYKKTLGDVSEYVQVANYSPSSGSQTVYGFKGNTGNAYVTDTGFRLPVGTTNTSYYWEAIE